MATEKRLIREDVTVEAFTKWLTSRYDGRMPADIVDEIPTVDAVEVVHGRWIHTAIEDDNWGGTFHKWTCSNCDFSTGHNPNGTNYCPNCGAKMDGAGNA